MQDSVIGQIKALQDMTVAQLQERWREVFGESSRSRNKPFLYRRIAWELQAKAYGGLSADARERLRDVAPDHFPRAVLPRDFEPPRTIGEATTTRVRPPRDHRLPSPGTIISRSWRGRDLRLQVLPDGCEVDGVHYDSLSAAARAITGARWNGRLFWGVTQRKRRS